MSDYAGLTAGCESIDDRLCGAIDQLPNLFELIGSTGIGIRNAAAGLQARPFHQQRNLVLRIRRRDP